jgi:hypothetical protein
VRSGGRTARRATTLRYAARQARAGDVVCLLAGTYRLSEPLTITLHGTRSAWIVFRSYGGRATLTAARPLNAALITVHDPGSYLQFSGLSFDGGTTRANEAVILGHRVHHVRLIGNDIRNMSAAGLAALSTDYVTFAGNVIHRFGDGVGWSSGISVNSDDGAVWADRAPGFHTVITGNVISGGVDNSAYHSDGNAIIVDLGGDIAPILIANNLAYENGGRCIENKGVQHVWVVNNTCYKNGLDSRLGQVGEIQNQDVEDVHLINNVAVAWSNRYPYKTEQSVDVTFSHNVAFGGLPSIVPDDVVGNPAALRVADPKFVNPPTVDPAADRQWQSAPTNVGVAARFRPAPGSPLLKWGVDPRAEPGVNQAYRSALVRFLARDLSGNRRVTVGRPAVGAFNS